MKRHSLPTMYGIGLVRIAPGTFGSLAAALLAYPTLVLPYGDALLAGFTGAIALLATIQSERYMRDRHTAHDPQEIVIDELVGQWLTYVIFFGWLRLMTGDSTLAHNVMFEFSISPWYLALGLVLFRVFDIFKPWPICAADRHIKGGFGVMFDDILAAIPAGTLLYVAFLCAPLGDAILPPQGGE